MNLLQLRPYRSTPNLIIPMSGVKGKNVAIYFYPENENFLDAYRFINITPSKSFRFAFVPTILKPLRVKMTPDYRKKLLQHKLRPLWGFMSELSEMEGKNFYIDFGNYINLIQSKMKIVKFDAGRGYTLANRLITSASSVNSELYQRVLLYSINVNKAIHPVLKKRRIWPIFLELWKKSKDENIALPYDKLILHLHDATSSRFVLLYDSNYKINIARIRGILLNLKQAMLAADDEEIVSDTAEEIVQASEIEEIPQDTNKFKKLKNVVVDYLKNNPTIKNNLKNQEEPITKKSAIDVASSAVAVKLTGNKEKTKIISKTATETEKKAIIVRKTDQTIVKEKVHPETNDFIIKNSNPEALNDYQNPKHIFEKRKQDFNINLKNDIVNAFKTLEKKEIPFSIENVDFKTITSPEWDLSKTVKDVYSLELKDNLHQLHQIKIELPHISENGSFVINGQEKVLTNQNVIYPIFFPKPYMGMFQSTYASLSITSKKLKNSSYFILHMAGPRFPIILWLGYKLGFDETMKLFNVTYNINSSLDSNANKIIKLSNAKFLCMYYDENNEVADQICQSFSQISPGLKPTFDIGSKKSWQTELESFVGNRNCTYTLEQVWENIVTPIERQILSMRGDPTDIVNIVKFICEKIVVGKVDDRNSLDTQRVRISEMFTSEIQKQVLSAYNEYESKRLGGDSEAKLYINPTKTFSDVINSPNVNPLENINPMEELASKCRITPVGPGGLPNPDAYPQSAMNIHYTYFGNIDPLETPDGPGVGIQQHLSIGSSIGNIRGLFEIKDRKDVNPSEILSVCPSSIPFVESNDGCRITMASSNIKQALPLTTLENPMVQTGFESIFTPLLSNSFILRSPESGEITEITQEFISIRDKDGKMHFIDTTPKNLRSGQGKLGLSTFKPIIPVGHTVKKNEIIAEGANIKDGVISNGINLLVGFMPWKGYNFEDGMVISESAAKKFFSVHVENEDVYLDEDDDVAYIADKGTVTQKGGILLSYSKSIYDVESFKHLRTDGGKVVEIEIYSNIEEENIPEKLFPIYEKFKEKYELIHKTTYPLGKFREGGEKIQGILIKFIVQQNLELLKGDKIANRHYNKGVVAIIEKDENMPKTPWGERLDLIYNPLSIINRMNTGQIMEMYIGLISKRLSKLIESDTRIKFSKMLEHVMPLLDGTEDKLYSKSLLKKINSLSDPQYNKMREKIINDGFLPIIIPPFKGPSRDNILSVLKFLDLKTKYPLDIPNMGKTKPVAVGYNYVMKLEHQAEKKIHSRSFGTGYVSKTFEPTRGKKNEGGQKIGEGDLYSLLAKDCPVTIDEFFGPLSTDQITKNEMMYEIIQNGETEAKKAKSNPVKDLYSQYMMAIHLTSI